MRKAAVRQSGSYTVEMSFLMPVVILCVVFLFYLSFYVHDRAVLQTQAARGAAEAAEQMWDFSTPKYPKLHKQLLMGRRVKVSQIIDGKKITVTLSCDICQPGSSLLKGFTPGGFRKLTASASAYLTDPLLNIRQTRKKDYKEKKDESDYGNGS